MRKIILALTLTLGTISLGACTPEQVQADMDQAKKVLAAINRGVRVTTSAVRQALDAACANPATVGAGSQAARAILMQQVGPNTTRNIDTLDRATASYAQVCAAASNPNATDLAALLSAAIATYAQVQAAQRAAQPGV